MRLSCFPYLLMALALGALSRCAESPSLTPCATATATNAQAVAMPARVPDLPQSLTRIGRHGVRVTDGGLQPLVVVDEVAVGREPGGSARIAVRVLNCTGGPLQLEGATQFLDSNGTQSEPPSIWKRLFLPPHGSRTYEEVSTGPSPALLSVDLRGGR